MKPLALAVLLAVPAALPAQVPDSTPLAPIVVTATRAPAPAASLGSAVTVLDGDALRAAGVRSVGEALRGVPSLTLAQAGPDGAQASLFLRGGEGDYVRVLLDGVPLNQAGGAIDLGSLTTENVERIEVVRGPASVLYGSDAMTGVIQVFTRRAIGRRAMLDGQGGTRGTWTGTAEVAMGTARSGVTLGAQHQASDGVYDVNNAFANTSVRGSLVLAPDARTDFRLSAQHRDGAYHYPTNGSGVPTDSNAQQRSRQTVVSLEAGRRIAPALELRALLGFAQGRDSTDDQPDTPGDTLDGNSASRRGIIRRSADLRAAIAAGARTALTVGGAVEHQRERDVSVSSFPGFGTTASSTAGSRTNRAVYAQAVTTAGRVSLQAGARLDDNSRFGTFGTSRLGVAIAVTPATRLRFHAGTAFKEPTFDETENTAFSVGNPDLRPERSLSIEAGLERQLGARASVRVTGFRQRFRDMIQYAYGGGGPDYHNVAAASADGAEAEAFVVVSPRLRASLSYTWLHAVQRDSGGLGNAGARLLRRPGHSGSASLEWYAPRGHSAGVRSLVVGSRNDVAFSGFTSSRVLLPAYVRVDLWGSVAVRDGLTVTARIENVANASYSEIYGFRTWGRRLLIGGRLTAR